MKQHDLLSHLAEIINLTYEDGMNVYTNMRIIRGKVMALVTYLKAQDPVETQAFLYDADYQPLYPGRVGNLPRDLVFSSMQEALEATTILQAVAPKIVLKSESGVLEINKVE